MEGTIMHDFFGFQSGHSNNSFLKSWSPINYVSHFIHNLQSRHEAQNLAQRDDHILSDIGISRDDVENAAHMAITKDAMAELHKAQLQHHREDETATHKHSSESLAQTNLRSRL
jgi:uncharacterized protein YjiS (DUF1127 family)